MQRVLAYAVRMMNIEYGYATRGDCSIARSKEIETHMKSVVPRQINRGVREHKISGPVGNTKFLQDRDGSPENFEILKFIGILEKARILERIGISERVGIRERIGNKNKFLSCTHRPNLEV